MPLSIELLRQARSFSVPRRHFLRSAACAGVGAVALGGVFGQLPAQGAVEKFNKKKVKDTDILNFALNLEYLEAEFYLRAAFGSGLDAADVTGSGTAGDVTGGTQVPFVTDTIQQYAEEIAMDEQSHVKFLRAALAPTRRKDPGPVVRPAIDLSASFTAAAVAAGIITAGQTFDPFADEASFLLGAFIFEDVGVTAYKGAAPIIKDPDILAAAAGILAVEAYHAGEIRTLLYGLGQTTPSLIDAAQKISDLRDTADADGDSDQGITDSDGNANIIPTDSNGLAFSRTFEQVLSIVYLGGAPGVGGGFFPSKLNGLIA